MHALVVDDSRATRKAIGNILASLGFEITEAGDGRQALDALRGNAVPDVALVDWNMPVMDGLEFVLAIRADQQYSTMKVMMVTAENDADHMIRALEAGADEYVMKPFTAEVIRDKFELLGIFNES